MKRRLLAVVSALSLLLCVATVVLWVRSYQSADYFSYMHSSASIERLIASRGDFVIYCARSNQGSTQPGYRHQLGDSLSFWHRPGSFPVMWQWGVFQYEAVPPPPPPSAAEINRAEADRRASEAAANNPAISVADKAILRWQSANSQIKIRYRNSHWAFLFPAWLAMLLTLLLPALWAFPLLKHFRRHEPAARPCPTCGYDLRATPDRCPECGTAVRQNASSMV